MEQEPPLAFLDVPTLLESSEPRPRVPWLRILIIGCLTLIVIAAFSAGAGGGSVLQGFAWGLSAFIILAIPWVLQFTLRQVKMEQAAVQGIAELVQLRRWPESAMALQQFLSRPARTQQLRAEAIVYLAAVLSRYHRFDDAIAVHNYLLEHDLLNAGAAYGVRMGRAMAMLREDHLFDADRSISELRRIGPRDSAGFALVEIYRDVLTGHPEDAIGIFVEKLPALRDQLGHRLGDVYALLARAYDLLDRKTEAADAFKRATLLSPIVELCRRYPEVQKLVGRYEPAAAPSEMS
ncbi:MAG TPA: hypothetical protein VG326_17955 [Tepidisphaeraceae bacterium]|nr:hypothetical protein [Tepidisphaeraceae bacterium]